MRERLNTASKSIGVVPFSISHTLGCRYLADSSPSSTNSQRYRGALPLPPNYHLQRLILFVLPLTPEAARTALIAYLFNKLPGRYQTNGCAGPMVSDTAHVLLP